MARRLTDPNDPRFTPTEHLSSDLGNLAMGWAEEGIDADDFLKCGECNKWIADLVEGTEPPVEDDELCKCEDAS